MDLPKHETKERNGESHTDAGMKPTRKKRNRSAKQKERAQKYRESRNYINYLNHVRHAFSWDPTTTAACQTVYGCGQPPLNAEQIESPYTYAGATSYQLAYSSYPDITPSEQIDERLCLPAEEIHVYNPDQIFPQSEPQMLNTGTIVMEPVSNLRASAEVFVPAALSAKGVFKEDSREISEAHCNVKKPVSKLRASAEIFVPASANTVDSTLETSIMYNVTKPSPRPQGNAMIGDPMNSNTACQNEQKMNNMLSEHNFTLENSDISQNGLISDNKLISRQNDKHKDRDEVKNVPDDNVKVDDSVTFKEISIPEESVLKENSVKSETEIAENKYSVQEIVKQEHSIIPEQCIMPKDIVTSEEDTIPEDNVLEAKPEEFDNLILKDKVTSKETVTSEEKDKVIPKQSVLSKVSITLEDDDVTSEDSVITLDNVLSEEKVKPEDSDEPEYSTITETTAETWDSVIPERNITTTTEEECHIIPENNNTDVVNLPSENIMSNDDENDMFAVLALYANSTLHCVINQREKSDSKSREEDFGYVYFTMPDWLK